MVIPHLTNEQRRAALAKAGLARQRRAEIKQAIKHGSWHLTDVFSAARDDEAIARMKIFDLLVAFPKIGEVRAQTIMEEIGIAPSRRIGGLGYRQRASLIEWLG